MICMKSWVQILALRPGILSGFFLWCSAPSGGKFQDCFLLSVMLWPHSSMSVQFIVHKYRISAPHSLNYSNVFVMKQ